MFLEVIKLNLENPIKNIITNAMGGHDTGQVSDLFQGILSTIQEEEKIGIKTDKPRSRVSSYFHSSF